MVYCLRMTKSLIQRVRERVLLVTATLSLGFIGCKFPNDVIPTDLNVSPTSGSPPLNTIITLNEHENNITEYEIDIDNNKDGTIDEIIKQKYPINIGRLFNVNTDVYGQVTYSSGKINKFKKTVNVDNSSPVAIFSAHQDGTNSAIVLNLDGNDLNGKQDIKEYRAGVDENKNHILEDNEVKIRSQYPIINGIIPASYGTYNVLGECIDSQKAIGRAEIEVIVGSEPVPIANLSLSKTSGNILLEDLVSLNGSATNASIVKYEIGADENNNGILEPDEIISTSTSAITNKEIIFIKSGIYKIIGQVIDSNGKIGKTNQQVDIYSGNQSTNLTETMQFLGTNTIGSKFLYAGQINNTTSPYNPVTIDNSLGDSLEFKLIREIISGIGEKVIDEKIQDNIKITLKQSGYLKMEQKSDDTLEFTIANADVSYNGSITFPVGNTPLVYSKPHAANIISNSGNYCTETIIKYFMNDSPSIFTFLSDFFSVN